MILRSAINVTTFTAVQIGQSHLSSLQRSQDRNLAPLRSTISVTMSGMHPGKRPLQVLGLPGHCAPRGQDHFVLHSHARRKQQPAWEHQWSGAVVSVLGS